MRRLGRHLELDGDDVALAADALGVRAGAHVDAVVLAQRFRHFLAGEGLLAREQTVAALDQDDSGAEAGPRLRELGADRPPAEHDQALGNVLGVGRLAVVPGAHGVESIERWHRSTAAGGDDDHTARNEHPVADTHAPLPVEPARATEQLDPAFLQPGELTGVVANVDHLVATRQHGCRVEGLADRQARHPLRLAEQVGRPQQRLRGHAGVVGALAADQVLLDDRHRHAAVGKAPRADLSRRPGAEHDRVELMLCHHKDSRSAPGAKNQICTLGRSALTGYSYPTPYNRST